MSTLKKVLVIIGTVLLTAVLGGVIFVAWWFSPCVLLPSSHTEEAGYYPPKPVYVSFLTYNMFLRTTFIVDEETAKVDGYKNPRMNYFIENEMSKFGIMALQETWMMGNDRKKVMINNARKKGFQFVRSTCRSMFKYGMDSMLLQLSHHPILNHDEFTYTTSMGVDAMASKGVMWTRISIGGYPECTVDIYNTHLQAGGGVDGDAIRLVQMKELHDFMVSNDQKYGAKAKIVAGDFNTDRLTEQPQYDFMRSTFSNFTDLLLAVGSNSSTTPTGYQVIDYIMWDPLDSKISIVLERTKVEQFATGKVYPYVSDHFGVSTILVCN